jgi:hypothetical protein
MASSTCVPAGRCSRHWGHALLLLLSSPVMHACQNVCSHGRMWGCWLPDVWSSLQSIMLFHTGFRAKDCSYRAMAPADLIVNMPLSPSALLRDSTARSKQLTTAAFRGVSGQLVHTNDPHKRSAQTIRGSRRNRTSQLQLQLPGCSDSQRGEVCTLLCTLALSAAVSLYYGIAFGLSHQMEPSGGNGKPQLSFYSRSRFSSSLLLLLSHFHHSCLAAEAAMEHWTLSGLSLVPPHLSLLELPVVLPLRVMPLCWPLFV